MRSWAPKRGRVAALTDGYGGGTVRGKVREGVFLRSTSGAEKKKGGGGRPTDTPLKLRRIIRGFRL